MTQYEFESLASKKKLDMNEHITPAAKGETGRSEYLSKYPAELKEENLSQDNKIF